MVAAAEASQENACSDDVSTMMGFQMTSKRLTNFRIESEVLDGLERDPDA
jgi:hypothetical protein